MNFDEGGKSNEELRDELEEQLLMLPDNDIYFVKRDIFKDLFEKNMDIKISMIDEVENILEDTQNTDLDFEEKETLYSILESIQTYFLDVYDNYLGITIDTSSTFFNTSLLYSIYKIFVNNIHISLSNFIIWYRTKKDTKLDLSDVKNIFSVETGLDDQSPIYKKEVVDVILSKDFNVEDMINACLENDRGNVIYTELRDIIEDGSLSFNYEVLNNYLIKVLENKDIGYEIMSRIF